jgi:hypothetical protein
MLAVHSNGNDGDIEALTRLDCHVGRKAVLHSDDCVPEAPASARNAIELLGPIIGEQDTSVAEDAGRHAHRL